MLIPCFSKGNTESLTIAMACESLSKCQTNHSNMNLVQTGIVSIFVLFFYFKRRLAEFFINLVMHNHMLFCINMYSNLYKSACIFSK